MCEKSATHKITLMVPSGVIHFFSCYLHFLQNYFCICFTTFIISFMMLIPIAMFLCSYTLYVAMPELCFSFHYISYVIIHTALFAFRLK